MSTRIFDIQEHLVSLLTSDEFFTAATGDQIIPVFYQRIGDVQSKIEQSLLRASGVCVFVLMPKIEFDGVDQKIVLKLTFTVFVSENPTINSVNANQPAEKVMEKVFELVHWKPNLPAPPAVALPALQTMSNPRDRMSRFTISKSGASLLPPTVENPSLVNYAMDFETRTSIP